MSSDPLDKIFNPKSVVVIGASDRVGSVGYIVFNNLLTHFKQGRIYPVNVKRDNVQGAKSYTSVLNLPETVDLAIVCTPSETVKSLVEDCGKAGIRGMIIITAGFAELGAQGRQLLSEIEEVRKNYGIRIIGPNCLGIIKPSLALNATFADTLVPDGKVAFISQSGALGCAVLDWALTNNIGMSNFVSIGSMMDVDFGDLIDYFNKDEKTESIFLYIESITKPQKFILNSRVFASKKPIFAIKSGREVEGARAAASHTGALAGEDSLYGAAFNRAGIVRVDTSPDFMDLFEAVSLQPLPKGNRLLIITNAGGPGVMATDHLIQQGGKLAELTEGTINKLNGFLPPFWSHANPVDLLGDAADDRYVLAFDMLLEDENVDAILVLLTPQAMTKSTKTATALVEKAKNSKKPVFASWMGQGMVTEGRDVLMKGGIPSYDTPEEAIDSFIWMYKATRQKEILAEIQETFSFQKPNKGEIKANLKAVASTGRKILSEQESKELLEKYGISTTLPKLAKSSQEAAKLAKSIGFPIVMKVQSEDISHKSDANCVILDIKDEETAATKFEEIMVNARAYKPDARVDGVSIQKMVPPGGFEIILGSKRDTLFGPSVLFGMGGVAVEVIKDTSIMLAPVNRNQARSLVSATKVGTMLKKGFRNRSPANMAMLEEAVIKFSELAADFPEIKEMDINPLRVDDKSCIVLDARIVLV